MLRLNMLQKLILTIVFRLTNTWVLLTFVGFIFGVSSLVIISISNSRKSSITLRESATIGSLIGMNSEMNL